MVTNIDPGDSSSSSCSCSRKDGTASVVITVDTPSKSSASSPDPDESSAAAATSGDTSIRSPPSFAPNSESTPLKAKTNVNHFRNSLAMSNNSSCPDGEQLIGDRLTGSQWSDAEATTGAAGGAGLSPRYGVGSLSLPSNAFGRSKGMPDIPSKEGGGDSACSEFVKAGAEEVACWWTDPKVRENWRVFVAAFGLLVVGTILITVGIVVCVLPEIGFQSYVFFVAGFFCFIPGVYHVVYVYCAARGRKGYDFYQLPLFN